MNDQTEVTEVTETTETTETTAPLTAPLTVHLSEETKQEWVTQYDERQTFPLINKKPYVPCSVTGKLVIMGANNLRTRVIKFGGPMNLLNNFVCREQVKEASLKIQQIVKDTNNLRKSVTSTKKAEQRAAKLTIALQEQAERRAQREAAKAAKTAGPVDVVLEAPTEECLVP